MNSSLSGIHNYYGIAFNKIPKHIEYVGPFTNWDGITIFTGIVIAILLSRECLFQPNIINV